MKKKTAAPKAPVQRQALDHIAVIGVASGIGAKNPECQDGPKVLRTFGFLQDLETDASVLHWEAMIHPDQRPQRSAEKVAEVAKQVAGQVHACLSAGNFPLVIGGDHSCAIGTWSGVAAALGEGENKGARLGLIWFDAHMDAHTPATSPSQALHGMPLACLLGHGDAHLTDLMNHGIGEKHRPVLRPEDVCLIGVRSFEWGEAALLHQLGVRIYFMDEVRERGLPEIVREALLRVRRETDGFGVSIDLDVLEPAEEPGVGSPVPGGIALHDMLEALAWVRATSGLKALEIVEYNPYSDHHFDTAAAVANLARVMVGADNAQVK